MSSQKGNEDVSQSIRRLAGLVGGISEAVISGLGHELDRYNQETTQLRFRNAFKSLQDASDNMRWIVKNELNLIAGRVRLIGKEVSSVVADFASEDPLRK